LNNVVLPAPFLPTIPTLCPVGTKADVSSRRETEEKHHQ